MKREEKVYILISTCKMPNVNDFTADAAVYATKDEAMAVLKDYYNRLIEMSNNSTDLGDRHNKIFRKSFSEEKGSFYISFMNDDELIYAIKERYLVRNDPE